MNVAYVSEGCEGPDEKLAIGWVPPVYMSVCMWLFPTNETKNTFHRFYHDENGII